MAYGPPEIKSPQSVSGSPPPWGRSVSPPRILRRSADKTASTLSSGGANWLGGDPSAKLLIAGIGLATLLVLIVGVPLVLHGVRQGDTANSSDPTTSTDFSGLSSFEKALRDQEPEVRPTYDRATLIERIDPSVVFLQVESTDAVGTGSGFVVDRHGTICTNRHVVEEGRAIVVRFQDETEAKARVVYVHPSLDIAFVKVTKAGLRLPPPIGLASKMPRKGEDVAAFGSPLGLTFTTSFGNVSAIREDDDCTFIQFTAPVSPGNSGGPITNLRGEVVAMTTFGYGTEQKGQNLNFAVSSIDIAAVLSQITAKGIVP